MYHDVGVCMRACVQVDRQAGRRCLFIGGERCLGYIFREWVSFPESVVYGLACAWVEGYLFSFGLLLDISTL
jgi:hypothetical protein